ncbi:branched-chain amino acid ABC transporter permease [Candidatus Bipolaricaulota bacterium]|nr:branched-chain amino acid ABC transporter permease [Candidatus Bipolaricaulota bacterium]
MRIRVEYAVVFLLSAFILAATPVFLGKFHLILLTETLIWGIFALSFDLVYGYTGMLSFGQSVFFGTGAYVFVYSFEGIAGLVIPLVLAALVSAVLGSFVGWAVVRVSGARFFLVTLVLAILFHLLAIEGRWLTGGDDGLIVPVGFPGLEYNYYLVLGISALTVMGTVILVKSPLGLVFKMIRDSERRTRLLGYSVKKYKIIAFSLSGLLAGLAGGLYSYISGFASAGFFHWSRSADVVIWTILGGAGTVAGPFIGAALLTFVRDSLSAITGKIYPVLVGGLIVFSVLVFPRGVIGMLGEVYEKIKEGWHGR